MLIDASADDLEGGSIVAREVGVCRIIRFISEAGQEIVLQFGVKILWQRTVRRLKGLNGDPLTLSATSPGYLASQSTRSHFRFLSSEMRWCCSGGLCARKSSVVTP